MYLLPALSKTNTELWNKTTICNKLQDKFFLSVGDKRLFAWPRLSLDNPLVTIGISKRSRSLFARDECYIRTQKHHGTSPYCRNFLILRGGPLFFKVLGGGGGWEMGNIFFKKFLQGEPWGKNRVSVSYSPGPVYKEELIKPKKFLHKLLPT